MNEKDILTRLQNGESAETIAQSLIAALNSANEQYQKEEEEKAKAEATNKKKIEDFQVILDFLYDFLKTYYCPAPEDEKAVDDAFAQISAKELVEMIDESTKCLSDLKNLSFKIPVVSTKRDLKAVDTIINDFLKSMGW